MTAKQENLPAAFCELRNSFPYFCNFMPCALGLAPKALLPKILFGKIKAFDEIVVEVTPG
jgi:hypothetical protein